MASAAFFLSPVRRQARLSGRAQKEGSRGSYSEGAVRKTRQRQRLSSATAVLPERPPPRSASAPNYPRSSASILPSAATTPKTQSWPLICQQQRSLTRWNGS